MGASKKLFVQMLEEEYNEIPMDLKQRFISAKVVFDDYDEFKDNKQFKLLYKAKKKATRDLEIFKFNNRKKE